MDLDPRQHWAFFAVGLLVYLGGLSAKALLWGGKSDPATLPRWRQIGRASMPYQPTLWGALAAFVPGLPMGFEADGLGPRLVYFAVAGSLARDLYDLARAAVSWAKRKLGARASQVPPEAGWTTAEVLSWVLAIATALVVIAVLKLLIDAAGR